MPKRKGLSTLMTGVLVVAIALVAAILIAIFIISTSGQFSEQISQQGTDRLKCVYTDFYIKNGTFNTSSDCTRGVNHTLVIEIKNTGNSLVYIGDVIIESRTGTFSRFYVGRNLSAGETRIFNATGYDSCVGLINQKSSGYTNNIKRIYVGSTNCPSTDAAGKDFFAILGGNQTESREGMYLMGLWRFNSSLTDSSGMGNTGTYGGGSASYANGVNNGFGNSLSMNGTSGYVQVSDSPSLDISGPFTIEAWVNVSNVSNITNQNVTEWWNATWQYRRRIIIENSSENLSNYQIPVNLSEFDRNLSSIIGSWHFSESIGNVSIYSPAWWNSSWLFRTNYSISNTAGNLTYHQVPINTTNLDRNLSNLVGSWHFGESYNFSMRTWWNDLWKYRKQINISNTAANLTNYQIQLSLNMNSEYVDGKIISNCNDIRFTYYNSTSNSETLINHYIDNCNVSSSNITATVNVSYLQNKTNTTIYMYYGNPSASNASNATNTFVVYDDFNDGVINYNIWENRTYGGWSLNESDGHLNTVADSNWGTAGLRTVQNFSKGTGYKMESKMYYQQEPGLYGPRTHNYIYDKNTVQFLDDIYYNQTNKNSLDALLEGHVSGDPAKAYYVQKYNNTVNANISNRSSNLQYIVGDNITAKMRIDFTNSRYWVDFYKNDVLHFSGSLAFTDVTMNTIIFELSGHYYSPVSNSHWDYVKIVKYANPEPSLIFGDEEISNPLLIIDSSGYGNHGAIKNFDNTSNFTSGVEGSALLFDGNDDYISLPNTILDNATNITTEFWIKTNEASAAILSGANNTQFNEFLIFITTGLNIYVHGYYWNANVNFSDGNWHHITVTRTNSTISVYKDGILNASNTSLDATMSGPVNIFPEGLVIGQEQDSLGGGFDSAQALSGTIDELKIFSTSLGQAEIQKDFCIGAYRLNHTAGQSFAYNSTMCDGIIRSYSYYWQDLRFVNNTNSTMNYWVESDVKSWVNVSNIINNTNTTIFAYYGNPNATNQSNITKTFIREIPNLTGAWSFNEGYGATTGDNSGNGNTGYIRGSALKFDGVDDFVNCGNASSLVISENITISAWISFANNDTDKTYYYVLDKSSATKGYRIQFNKNSSYFRFRADTSAGIAYADGNINFTAGKWYHVVGTYNGTRAMIYVDNIPTQGSGVAGTINLSTANLSIGIDTTAYDSKLNGTIDDVRVFNRSLTAAEVYGLYNNNYTNNTGLVLYIPFMNASGTKATDFSGYGNNGTLYNFSNTTAGAGDNSSSGWTTYGHPIWTDNGRTGYGMNFNGIDDFLTGNSFSGLDFANSSNITLTMWVNLNTVDAQFQSLISKGRSSDINNAAPNYVVRTNYDNISFYYRNSSDNGWNIYTATNAISSGSWHHIAVTYQFGNGSSMKTYVNGDLKSGSWTTGNGNEPPIVNQANLIFGRIYPTTTNEQFMNGTMDEIRIFNRALNATEISSEANGSGYATWSYPGKELVRKYSSPEPNTGKFGESNYSRTDSLVRDSSGYGNNGAMINFSLTNGSNFTTGVEGSALRFDGLDDYVTIADSSTTNSSNLVKSFSFEAWVNGTYNGSERAIAVKHHPLIIYANTSGELRVGIYQNAWKYVNVSSVLTNNTWYHIAVAWDNQTGNLSVYVNGTLKNSSVFSGGTSYIVNNSLSIGADAIYSRWYWNGTIDEVKLFNSSLSQAEIQKDFCIGAYRLNHTAGRNFSYNSTLCDDIIKSYSYYWQDLRFVNNTNSTMNYWVESDVKSWVNVSNIIYNNITTIFAYYGNPNATNQSNITKTFIREIQNLSGAWSFNEGSGATTGDNSGNGNTGYIRGSALKFDGVDDFVNFTANDTTLLGDNPSEWSAEIWFKTSHLPAINSVIVTDYFAASTDPTFAIYLLVVNSSGIGRFQCSIRNSSSTSTLYSPVSVIDNSWHHGAMTVSKTENLFNMYLDGVLVNQTTMPNDGDYTDDGTISIGALNLTGIMTRFFNGSIDGVRIYNRSLPATEVLQHYYGNFSNNTGLVLYIPFMNAAGTNATDYSGYGNNGTLYNFSDTTAGAGDNSSSGWTTYGHPIWTDNGRTGYGMNFNGIDDYIDIGNGSSLAIGNSITLEAWIKPMGYKNQTVLEFNNGTAFGVHMWQWTTFDKLFVNFIDTASAGHSITSPAGQLTEGNWYHIAGTYNGSYGKLFVNGVEVNSTNLGSFTLKTSNIDGYRLYAGRRISSSGYVFNGTIDEVRIFNRALNATEISSEANGSGYATWSYPGKELVRKYSSPEPNISNNGEDYFSFDQFYSGLGIIAKKGDSYGLRVSGLGVYGIIGGTSIYHTMQNTWQHLALTFDGSLLRLYINGTLVNSTSSSAPDANNDYFFIGGTSTTNETINGTIDELKVFNTTLSQAEIYDDYIKGTKT